MNYRTILLFGAPGTGKGTQGRVLGQIQGFYYFSSGDAFRSLRRDDPVAKIFFDYASRGLLVPDEITVELWDNLMRNVIQAGKFDPAKMTLILDGIPRDVPQAEIMSDHLDVRALFHLTCADKEVLIKRLQNRAAKENRVDDARLEVIQKRLETYERETRPVLDFYGPGLVHEIECNQKPLNVLRDMVEILVELDSNLSDEEPVSSHSHAHRFHGHG